jgi:hypothetical protein
MPRVALLFALLAMVLAGCGSCRNESTAGVSSSQADASVVRDAAPSEVIFDDLLHVVGSRVAVSSKVDNPHDSARAGDSSTRSITKGTTAPAMGETVP